MIDIERIWNKEGIEAARREIRSELQGVEKAIQGAEQMAESAKAEILNFKDNVLPTLLAERFLDEKVAKAEIIKIRKRMVELQEIIDDLPFLKKGLEAKKNKPNSENRKIAHRESFIQRYERVKRDLKQKYSLYLEQDLLHKAEILGCLEDAEAFLRNSKEDRGA